MTQQITMEKNDKGGICYSTMIRKVQYHAYLKSAGEQWLVHTRQTNRGKYHVGNFQYIDNLTDHHAFVNARLLLDNN